MYIYEIYVSNASLKVNKPFSYYSDFYIDAFKRVFVSFNNKKTQGIIVSYRKVESLDAEEASLGYKLKKIIDVVDDEPIINNKQFELAKWLSYTTVSPLVACINVMFPKVLKLSSKSKNAIQLEYIKKHNINTGDLTVKQLSIYNDLKDGMLLKDARKLSTSIINSLIKKGYISVYLKEKEYIDSSCTINDVFKELTKDQLSAYNGIINSKKSVSCLFGVTGSGKTEIYLHLARQYLRENKNVLILVPEISLTPQMIERVKSRFNEVIFYHSELNDQERYEQYKRVKDNKVKIVVGTRSSIFLPFNDLGLIIIDEEHDQSYKQDNTPCYSAKDVAFWLAKEHNAKVLLASATPSLETYSRGLKGTYDLFVLNKRINNTLPDINIINLKKDFNKNSIISNKLKDELIDNLNRNKQSIILLNRRGYQPIIRCSDCGSVVTCKNCDIPLSYHSDKKIFKCHQCSQEYKIIKFCPSCKSSNLKYLGYGTMKVEDDIKQILPSARIIRMDADSTSKKGSHKQILDDFGNHKYDILVGTQMISKGLDFPDVTLVGILNADAGLLHQDYNSAKTTLDLLMQTSGRSGRASDKGKVFIQTYNDDHYVIKTVINQDYNYFFNIEMNYREKGFYPPYTNLFEIIVADFNEEKSKNTASKIHEYLSQNNIRLFKPYQLRKLSNYYRYRILYLGKNKKDLLKITWDTMDKLNKDKNNSRITVDINPLYLE